VVLTGIPALAARGRRHSGHRADVTQNTRRLSSHLDRVERWRQPENDGSWAVLDRAIGARKPVIYPVERLNNRTLFSKISPFLGISEVVDSRRTSAIVIGL
jgi:hypothetical protein